MSVIYIDNFRGFTSTVINLKRVNFFVGENSTGKTSLLKLIRLLSDTRFWFFEDFSWEEAELGYFEEILTRNSPLKHFEVGVMGKGKTGTNAVLFRFEGKDGQPFLKEVRLKMHGVDMHAVKGSDGLKYRLQFVETKSINEAEDIDTFKKWVLSNSLKNKRFRVVSQGDVIFPQTMIMKLQGVLMSHAREKYDLRGIPLGIPIFVDSLKWIAPIRTEPRRTYDSNKNTFSPDGSHTPYILKSILKSNKLGDKRSTKVRRILERFGKDSGLFDKIEIGQLGNSPTSPFEVHVFLDKYPLKITNVGYGVSQILPILTEILASDKDAWFAIQQPEVHLHPRAQAALGDFLYKSAKEDMCFIIESHSDYMIDRFRLRLHRDFKESSNADEKNNEENSLSQVVFFSKEKGGNNVVCLPLSIDGNYPENQPKEFRDFFIREQLNLINI